MSGFKKISSVRRFAAVALFVAGSFVLSGTASAADAVSADRQSAVAAADDVQVSGTVVDKNGFPVIGAGVVFKHDPSVGVVADVDGNFTIDCPVGTVLVFSGLGFSNYEYTVTGAAEGLSIVLSEDSEMLDEIVVVGYGKQKKETVTGSIASVKGSDLRRSPESNLTNSLVGRMPGLIATQASGEPGNDYSSILIRGKATFGDSQPLFVIDGVANRWGNIDNLNPNDIESITILKDASAAIYGAQAANGVILVTTKRGREGKPTIQYEGSVSLSTNTRTPKLMNAYQYMDYDDEINAVLYPNDPTQQKFLNIKGQYIDGTNDKRLYDDTDWMSVIFQKYAPKTRHSISVSGGTDKVNYFISASYLYQEPGYRDTPFNFQTFQLRSNVDAKITKDFTVGFEMATREEKNHRSNYSTQNLFHEAYSAYPYLPDYYENGLPGPGIAWGNNIAILAGGGTGYNDQNNFYVNSKISFDLKMPWITEGLYFNGYVALDKQFQHSKVLNGMWHAYQYNQVTGNYDDIYDTTGNQTIEINESKTDRKMTTALLKLGYERQIGDNNFNIFVAYEQSREDGDWISGYRKGLYSMKPDYLFAGQDKDKNASGNAYVSARQNIFGRFSYGYLNRYLAEVTLRYDGSMNFPKESRWGFFPGMSLGWRIAEEPFMKRAKSTWLNELKLKASVGMLGNDSVSPFQYLGSYSLSAGPQFGTEPERFNGFTLSRTPNPNITWEVATTYNAGFESRFIDNKFYLDVQYFYSYRTNILTQRNASMPSYTGITLPDENLGKISNQGVELETSYSDARGDWRWTIGGTFTFARNRIEFFDEAKDVPAWQRRTGYPIDSYLLYLSDGLFQNMQEVNNASAHWAGAVPGDIRHIDYNGDGYLSSSDMVRVFKSPTPEIVYGVNLGLSWKGLELNVLFQGQGRAAAYIAPYNYNRSYKYYTDRWISEELTPHARYPRAFSKDDPNNMQDSDFWLRNAWFLRLKNAELSYNLPQSWMEKANMQGVRIFLSGSNLFTFDEIKIFDPECGNSGGMYYPQQKIFNAGVMITF